MFYEIHVFQDNMNHRKICLMKVMLCRRKCLAGVHVLGWHIFQDDVFYWNACFKGGQILFEGMSYKKSCLTGVPVLHEYML